MEKLREKAQHQSAVHPSGISGSATQEIVNRLLAPDSPLFLTPDGQPYALTAKALPSGVISYSCNALGAVISKLHSNAGIEGGNAQAGRRTLAVKLARKGFDLVHIKTLLGHKSVETTKRLVEGDPANLASIVAGAV